MKLADRYVYPAIFEYEDGKEISVFFPDLDVATSGINEEDALFSARECLGCVMAGLEEDGEVLPVASKLENLTVKENQRSALIDVFMPSVRMARVNKSVSRTVTLPAWLNAVAIEHNINFSQLLQDAIKKHLNMQEA